MVQAIQVQALFIVQREILLSLKLSIHEFEMSYADYEKYSPLFRLRILNRKFTEAIRELVHQSMVEEVSAKYPMGRL